MTDVKDLDILIINGVPYKTRLSRKFMQRKPFRIANPKVIQSFIPGTVLDIMVRKGQQVSRGDILIILDAMKMQNKLKADTEGKISQVFVRKGERVSKGSVLLKME